MADPNYKALAAHLDPSTADVHSSDQVTNQSSATGGTVTAALNHIHNTRPSADNTLTAGAVLIGAGDGHLEASGVQLSALATDAEVTAAIAAHTAAPDPHPGYMTPAEASAAYATIGHNHAGVYDPIGTANAAMAGHLAAPDPHPQYATTAEAAAAAPVQSVAGRGGNVVITSADLADLIATIRAQVLAELVAGANITLTPSGSGAGQTITVASTASGVNDHGALTGLADDDHAQYLNNARGDARYAALSHASDTANPHAVTKAQVGLGNCDNTADADKPISTATQTALNGKANTAHSHPLGDLTQSGAVAGQVAQWDGSAWVPSTPVLVKIAEGNFSNATTHNITIPSGYKNYKLLCRNFGHTHTAATRLRVRLFNGSTAQTVRNYTGAVTDVLVNSALGETGVGQNADLELDGDFAGSYNRGISARYTTHQTPTVTNAYAFNPFAGASENYTCRLETALPITVIQLSWILGNIAAKGDWTLYAYN